MWNNPWKMKEGFVVGAVLIVLGLVLQLAVGPVDWSVFKWPVNGIVMAGFMVLIAVVYLFGGKWQPMRFLATYQATIPTLTYAVVLTVVMGLTRQQPGGSWFANMLSFWPFVLVYVLLALQLGQVILVHAIHFSWKRDIPFMLNHVGLFLAMTTATLGNADVQRLKMVMMEGQPEWRAIDGMGMLKEMPMTIELKKFIMETYDDGSPKRYASNIQIHTPEGENIDATIDVNKPIELKGWKIYQYGYDTNMGAESKISILELVSDPWLPLVYAGIYMMLGGAVFLFVRGKKN